MVGLTSLEVKKNSIQRLPSLSKLVKLVFVDASENKITCLPELPLPSPADGSKSVLDRIYMSYNKLRDWGDVQSQERQVGSITELLLSNNLFDIIDPSLAVMRNLQVLDVSNNNINDIPATIGYLNSLQRLVVEGNPIRSIRRALLSSSTTDLKAFLRTRGPPLTLTLTHIIAPASSHPSSSIPGGPNPATTSIVVIDDYSASAPGFVTTIPAHLITPMGNVLTDRIRDVSSNGTLDLSSMGLVTWTPEFNLRLDQSHLVSKNSSAHDETRFGFGGGRVGGGYSG